MQRKCKTTQCFQGLGISWIHPIFWSFKFPHSALQSCSASAPAFQPLKLVWGQVIPLSGFRMCSIFLHEKKLFFLPQLSQPVHPQDLGDFVVKRNWDWFSLHPNGPSLEIASLDLRHETMEDMEVIDVRVGFYFTLDIRFGYCIIPIYWGWP